MAPALPLTPLKFSKNKPFVWLLFFAVEYIYGINMEQLQLA
jgi:hypothetical protein